MPTPRVIDISHYQDTESLVPAAQAGIVGVIHKMTEGTGYIDDTAKARFPLAKEAGLEWGLYHFLRPGSMPEQVAFFYNQAERAGVLTAETLLVADYEDANVSLDDLAEFCELLAKAPSKSDRPYAPVIYSSNVLKEKLGGNQDDDLCEYRLWLAHYSDKPVLPPGWDRYFLWQFTDEGEIAGIDPPTDLNAYDGTVAELREEWAHGREPIPSPPLTGSVVEIKTRGSVKIFVNGKEVK